MSRNLLQANPNGKTWKSLVMTFLHLYLKAANHISMLIPGKTSSRMQEEEGEKYSRIALQSLPELLDKKERDSFQVLSDPKYRCASFIFS